MSVLEKLIRLLIFFNKNSLISLGSDCLSKSDRRHPVFFSDVISVEARDTYFSVFVYMRRINDRMIND